MSSPLVWLVTGASSGLGLHITKAALAAGHKVVATSRNPSKTPDAVAEIEASEKGAWLQLDVTADNLEEQAAACLDRFGQIDVLVNNAGYGAGGPLETITMLEARRVMETNFFGAVRLIKAAIPHMRTRRTGTIVNVSSTEGFATQPGISMYAASKFALEGVSESIAAELAGFGIRVLLVEPGGMRTNFLSDESTHMAELGEAYKGTVVEYVFHALQASHGKQMLDPERSAERIVEAVVGSGEGWPASGQKMLRLPLGKEAADRMKAKGVELQDTVNTLEGVWSTVDFPA